MPALYRDPLVDNVGVWGIPTSTLDWCEENYAVTRYVAEFCKFLTPFISSLIVYILGLQHTRRLEFYSKLLLYVLSINFSQSCIYIKAQAQKGIYVQSLTDM